MLQLHVSQNFRENLNDHHSADKQANMSHALLTQLVVSAPRSILGSDIPKSSRARTGCPSVSNLYVTQVSCKMSGTYMLGGTTKVSFELPD